MQQQQQRSTVVDGYARRGAAQPLDEYTPQPAQPLARRQTFVPPAPRQAVVPDVQAVAGLDVTSPAQSMVELRTTYEDRSKGFLWAITPVAVVTGVLSCVAGVALFAVPLLSWSLLQTFLAVFCVTWIIGYTLHLLMSPDGVLFLNAFMLWRTVRAEQKHRHDRYWQAREDAREDARL